MHYVNAMERQIIKPISKDISSFTLSIMVKADGQLHKGMLLYLK